MPGPAEAKLSAPIRNYGDVFGAIFFTTECTEDTEALFLFAHSARGETMGKKPIPSIITCLPDKAKCIYMLQHRRFLFAGVSRGSRNLF